MWLSLRTKLGDKTLQFIFFGYANHSKAFRFLILFGLNKDSIIESHEAIFFELELPFKPKPNGH